MNAHQLCRLPLAKTLNLGSGKDFREDAFNIDIDDTWNPDAVLDLSVVNLAVGVVPLNTARFGAVRLEPGCFDRIIANDVLEHVPDLMKLMTTCLELLCVGGRFEVSVPYDLSYGAWQDPTHVRAFNERSWLYYTDWFWYMGWNRSRFVIDDLRFVPSSTGEALARQGMATDILLTTPRAVDSMSVTLRKVELSAEDRATWEHWRERRTKAQSPRAAAVAPAASTVDSGPRRSERSVAAASNWADQHCIWIVSPKDYDHHHAFDEIALALSEAFGECGGSAPIVRHPSEWGGRVPIVLGAHLLGPNSALILPPGSVIYNLEQVSRDSGWIAPLYLDLMRRFSVLDYSHRNIVALKSAGINHAKILIPGFSAGLSQISQSPVQDIDVLFYGSLNERRAAVLNDLRTLGLVVVHLFNVYGAERNSVISRAKLVLNLHFYEAAIFESPRVVYLLANGACVVTEGELTDPDIAPYRGGLAVCAYQEIVPLCMALLADQPLRRALAEQGLSLAQRHRQVDGLADLFAAGQRAAPVAA